MTPPLATALASRPETELVLRTAVPGPAAENDARTSDLLRARLDWGLVVRLAQGHGTSPLLHWHLRQHEWAGVPGDARDALQGEFRRNAALNLLRTDEFLRLLERFEARAIPVVPFKGLTLAAYAYGNLALRQFTDLDLLLRPKDLDAGQEVLRGEGYAPDLDLPADRQAAYLRSIGQVPFRRVRDGSLVELHSLLMPRHFHFPLELGDLWQRLESLELGERPVRVLAGEDLLLVLSAHGAKHGFGQLSWISDLAAVLRNHPRIDLARTFERARALRSRRMLLLGLCLGHDLLGEAPPPVVRDELRADLAARALADDVWHSLTHDVAQSGFREAAFHLRAREHLRDGLAYAMSLAFVPTVADWRVVALPAAASFLYYCLRPLRLAGKYGSRLVTPRGAG